MKDNTIRILLIDDDEDDYILTRDILSDNDANSFVVDWASTYQEGEKALRENKYDIYLIDYLLGAKSGLELLKLSTQLGVKAPIIMLTGKGDRAIDFEAMQLGAADYLVKDEIDYRMLERSIRYSVEKYRSDKILYDHEQKYRILFERSIDAIFITDPSETFVNINRSFIYLLKYSGVKDTSHISLKDIFSNAGDYETYSLHLQRAGYVKDLEVSLRTREGKNISCVISTVELNNSEGEITGYQGIIRDITALKMAEQELRQAEKLALTGKLARTIAHEVRNPLTNIALSSDQLLSEHPNNESLTFYIDIIDRSVKRINKLVTELLESARPGELKYTGQDMNAVLEQTLELTRDRLNLRNIKVIKDLSDDIHPFPIDTEKMQLALLNIIINAIEAMQESKGILVIRSRQESRLCTVSIIDNGCGISKEHVSRLFDAFFTGKRDGMGLGLTAAHKIVQSHDGVIEVYSEPGEGTEFRLLFDTGKATQ